MKTIHDIFDEKVGLAKIYAEDGAFHSAARVLTEAAEILKGHANACDEALRSTQEGPTPPPAPIFHHRV